jgi:GGDEF domain-containing protein
MRRSDDDRATQRVLAAAFVSVDAAVAVVTAGGRLVTASQGFAVLCGRTLRALTGSALSNVLDSEVLGRVQRTLAGSAPGSPASVFRGGGARNDAVPFSAAFSLSVIEGRGNERLAVLTLRPDTEAADPTTGSAKAPTAVGKIQLIGLQEIKATLGPKWSSIADRAMILAEAAIRRRLDKQDVLSRTADQGFLIWFHNGTVEQNAELASRIARAVRIALLTEFADSVGSSVASATVALPAGSVPRQLSASAQSELINRRPGLAPDPAVEAARAYLAWAETELPVEIEQMFGRSGQPLPAVWCSLPDPVASRLEQAGATLDGESLGIFEMDLLRLRAGINVAAKAAASKLPRSCFVPVPCAFLASPRSSGAIKELLAGIDTATGSRLTLLLGGPFTDLSPTRLQELAAPLCSRVRAVGLAVQSISELPLNALQRPFSVVSFQPGVLGDVSNEADMWESMDAIHRTGAKVFARRIATPRQARMLIELGADFVCGTAPARVLS